MITLFRKNWFSKTVCTLFTMSHLGVAMYAPYAYSANSAANAQSAVEFYKSLPGLSANSNGTVQYGDGEAVNLNNVYPGEASSTSLDQLKSVYGNNGETQKLGFDTGSALASESSLRGEAYRAVSGSTKTTAKLKATDSIFDKHKDFLANQDKYMQDLDDCSMTSELNTDGVKQHIPDYKECTRTTSVSGTYRLTHPYVAGFLSHSSGSANIEGCGEACVTLWVGRVGDNYWDGRCKIYEEYTGVRVYNPQAISSAKLTYATWDDYMQIYLGEKKVFAGPVAGMKDAGTDGKYRPWNYSKGELFPPETEGPCELDTSWRVDPQADVTQNFQEVQDGDELIFKTRVSVYGNGEGYAKLEVRYDPSKAVSKDEWIADNQEGFNTFLDAVNQGYCQNYSVTCNETVTPDANGCAYINGVTVCEKDLKTPPIGGLSPFCRSATVVSNCGTDAGVNNSCKDFDNNNACKFIKSSCITGAAGGQSGCWQASETWDCGQDVTVPSTTQTETYQCAGAVQCINGTCLTPESEPSGDFQTAVAMLQAATYAVNEMTCGDETINVNRTCTLFKGEAATCKSALGGWVDCCNQPVDVSWIEYLQLTYYTLKVSDALAVKAGMFEQGKGMFDMGSELANSAIDAITKPAMSALDSLTGNAGSAVADKIADLGIGEMMDQAVGTLTKQVAQWTLDTFGSSVTNALFQAGGTAAGSESVAAVGSDGALASSVELSSTLTSAISVVGYAYMAYQVANILVNIIWACTADEFKLAVKKETKLATFIDSWCQSKVLGQCIEKRSSYCTFNSQIGRIFQEQGRAQLGIGWGDNKNPDCRGLTLEEFGRIDFQKVDLSEWIGSLYSADLLPTPESVNLDSITGSGSILNVDGKRKNSLDRFKDGVDSVDINDLKDKAGASIQVR